MDLQKRLGRVLLNRYKQRKQVSNDLTLEHCLEAARITVAHTRYCFLVTATEQACPSARLVEPISELDDFTFFIGTHPRSRKTEEIAACPLVTLAFGNASENTNLVVYGKAEVSDDPSLKRRYWKDTWRLFFPGGADSTDYCVIKVTAEKMEVLSFRHNVIPEPFGLRPATLVRSPEGWTLA